MRTIRSSRINRRHFLKQLGAAGMTASGALNLLPRLKAFPAAPNPVLIAREPVKNRTPLAPNAFYTLPLGSIRPAGWLLQQLQIQADGLSGHLDETWSDVGPNSGWLGGTGESWERGPYFLDGLIPLAYSLNDPRLKAKAQKFIDWTLSTQRANGMFGPRSNDDWWPRIVMLKALTQYQEATGDIRVIPAFSRYCDHQLGALPNRPLRDWGKYRWQDEALTVLWLYNRTGDPKLLELVRLLHQQGYDWQAEFVDFRYTQRTTPQAIGLKNGANPAAAMQTHGVNNAQAMKASPVWSLVSNLDADREAIFRQLEALDRYHGLPNGMFSADEHFAGPNPSQGIELCAVVEAMFSLEQSLAILGKPELGDRLERIAFNALPGAFTDDMWAHQYNQEPNQVECSLHRKPWTTDGPESNLYGLEPNFGCCTANFSQGWPKFTASLWMSSHDDGLVAAAYAPCEAHTRIRNIDVHVIEQTDYPFRQAVRILVHPASPLAFPLRLRIPSWAHNSTIQVNGKQEPAPRVGSFALLERTWKAGDQVEIAFPMAPRFSHGFHNSITVERGPLVFSYPIGEDWVKLRDRGMTADWQVYPSTPWNYALAVDAEKEENADQISVMELPVGKGPFTRQGAPVRLHAKARKMPDWRAEDGVADPVPPSPVSSDQPQEAIILLPYAAAKLRITAFPQLKS
ncbi:MAG TPA: beta-L-arabinofuranosidase domain-containing protein [Acidobacteriaceae bacterium]|nr:beta-L-arabinofuranosidase domain-containing protein [Acidobacteriaceae bacterium]